MTSVNTTMIRQHIKTAIRSFARSRFYTGIHLLGLGVAIASALFIFRYVTYHLNFDTYHQHAATTYKIVSDLHLKDISYNEGVSYAIYEALRNGVAGIDHAAYALRRQNLTVNVDGRLFAVDGDGAFVSSAWFQLFDYNWLSGSSIALDRPQTVALSAETAKRFFGETDPMGKTIRVEDNVPLEVIGIVADNPSNTLLKNALYISQTSIQHVLPDITTGFFTQWGYLMSTNEVFISLSASTPPASVEKTLSALTVDQFGQETGSVYAFKLLPLESLHLNVRYGGTVRKPMLATLGVIGIAILCMAVVNYVNLSLAQYARRSAEIGTRKVLGASHGQLFSQFMAESLLVSGLATILGISLLRVAIPLANSYLFVNEPLALYPVRELAIVGITCWLVISMLSGIYPAYVIGRLQALHALKDNVSLGSFRGRKVMVIAQNVVSQCLVIATTIMMVQVHFLRHTDMGFDRESVLMLSLPREARTDQDEWKAFLNAQPGVSSHSFCYRSPANHRQHGATLRFDNRSDWETWPARSTFADSAYLQTFGIRLLAGHNVRTTATVPEYLVNETMARQLGATDPNEILGKPLEYGATQEQGTGVIVGVVADYNTRSLHEPIQPTVISYEPNLMQSIAIKLNGQQVAAFIGNLEREWKARYPDQLLTYQFVDSQIEALYWGERVQQRLVWVASTVAVLIGCLGLLGLISLHVLQRTKEIGIRKVLGASVVGIVALLSTDFLKLVAIAFVIAIPIAWWATHNWLQGFAYRADMQWWMLASGGLVAMVIALLTVGGQAIRAALANPVDSLRDE